MFKSKKHLVNCHHIIELKLLHNFGRLINGMLIMLYYILIIKKNGNKMLLKQKIKNSLFVIKQQLVVLMQQKKFLMSILKHHTIMVQHLLNGQHQLKSHPNKPHGVSDNSKFMLPNVLLIVPLVQDHPLKNVQLVFHHMYYWIQKMAMVLVVF